MGLNREKLHLKKERITGFDHGIIWSRYTAKIWDYNRIHSHGEAASCTIFEGYTKRCWHGLPVMYRPEAFVLQTATWYATLHQTSLRYCWMVTRIASNSSNSSEDHLSCWKRYLFCCSIHDPTQIIFTILPSLATNQPTKISHYLPFCNCHFMTTCKRILPHLLNKSLFKLEVIFDIKGIELLVIYIFGLFE